MTTDATIIRPNRVFLMGVTKLVDIDPSMTPEEVLEHYKVNFPHLSNSTLSEPELQAGELVYTIEKPPVKTKG